MPVQLADDLRHRQVAWLAAQSDLSTVVHRLNRYLGRISILRDASVGLDGPVCSMEHSPLGLPRRSTLVQLQASSETPQLTGT